MVKLCDMPETERKRFVSEVSWVMAYSYHIDKESIKGFWDTVQIGVEAQRRA